GVVDTAQVGRRVIPAEGTGEVDDLTGAERDDQPLGGLAVDALPVAVRDGGVGAQQVVHVHQTFPLRLPIPRDPVPSGAAPPGSSSSREAPSSAASPFSTMSPSRNRIPRAISRHCGFLRSRNSNSMQKCLYSSPSELAMIASASASFSTAIRCSYQSMASASSVRLVSIRTSVRVSSGSSSGGSWYWSKPMGPPRRRSWRTVPIRGRSDATGRGGGGTPLGGQRSRPVLVVVDPAPSPRTLGRHDRQSARTRTRAR